MPSFYLENLLSDWDEGLVRMVSPWDGLFNRCPLGLIQLGPQLNALILAWSQCYKYFKRLIIFRLTSKSKNVISFWKMYFKFYCFESVAVIYVKPQFYEFHSGFYFNQLKHCSKITLLLSKYIHGIEPTPG